MTDPGEYARELSGHVHGPHDDQATVGAAGLAAETIRYLCYATTHGGLSSGPPSMLSPATCRPPPGGFPSSLLSLPSGSPARRTPAVSAGDRPAGRLGRDARAIFGEAAAHAASLAAALAGAHNLTATLRAGERAPEESAAP